jgi:hypothetical protein
MMSGLRSIKQTHKIFKIHPNPYFNKSAPEVVVINKDCIQDFKKDDESKEIILKSMKV